MHGCVTLTFKTLLVGVVLYTTFGGIKATFLTDYVHTVIILVIIFMFAFTAYATSKELGSPSKVYDLLTEAAQRHPVAGNQDGSYLTMRSQEGAIFFVINIVGNFGTVFLDNGRSKHLMLQTCAANLVRVLQQGYRCKSSTW